MKLDTTYTQPQLSNLTYSEIEELIRLYYNRGGSSASFLCELYNIPFAPKDLSTILPLLIDEKNICGKCKEPMAQRYLCPVTSKEKLSPSFCKACEIKNKFNKSCEEVAEIKAIASKTNNLIINLCFKDSSLSKTPLNTEMLTLKDRLYLMLLKKMAKISDHHTVYGLQRNRKFMPFNDGKLLEYLIRRNIISLSPSTQNDALTIKNKKVTGLDIYAAYWRLHITPESSNIIEIENLKALITTETDSTKNLWKQIYRMRLEIAIDECLEFFVVMSAKLGFPITGGHEQGQIKKDLITILKKLPQSHCFKFIWMLCERNALSFYDDGFYNKDYFMINEIFEASVCYENEGLLEDPYEKGIARHHYCPRSQLNILFFNDFLGFDIDTAFYLSPDDFLTQFFN